MHRFSPLGPRAVAATAIAAAGCDGASTAPDGGSASLEISLDGAPALDAASGH